MICHEIQPSWKKCISKHRRKQREKRQTNWSIVKNWQEFRDFVTFVFFFCIFPVMVVVAMAAVSKGGGGIVLQQFFLSIFFFLPNSFNLTVFIFKTDGNACFAKGDQTIVYKIEFERVYKKKKSATFDLISSLNLNEQSLWRKKTLYIVI